MRRCFLTALAAGSAHQPPGTRPTLPRTLYRTRGGSFRGAPGPYCLPEDTMSPSPKTIKMVDDISAAIEALFTNLVHGDHTRAAQVLDRLETLYGPGGLALLDTWMALRIHIHAPSQRLQDAVSWDEPGLHTYLGVLIDRHPLLGATHHSALPDALTTHAPAVQRFVNLRAAGDFVAACIVWKSAHGPTDALRTIAFSGLLTWWALNVLPFTPVTAIPDVPPFL